ncbi:endonuclease domain-containing protein [Caulobacter zeae]|uniref:endonuclease domain-containing protein n=1 Tax=Caulobacter zeae TaxID=2055137 RepID=UPI001F0C88A4|nr:endonuclease domain-containing protein [Caulobacter zeae]
MFQAPATAALAQARHLRRAPVATERLLWSLLRDRKLDGLKFRRQVPLGRYIADCVCFRHRLIIEADGPHHDERDRDLVRDAWLREQGFRVLRFSNRAVQDDREVVLAAILAACGR